MAVEGLDQPCGTCGRVSGDHTLREWAVCLGTVTLDLPFEPIPDDAAAAASAAVRERFQLDPDLIVADNVVIRAATLDGNTGAVQLRLPVLLHEFQISTGSATAPATIAKVAFLSGDGVGMRNYGRLVRDSANGAANRAEGKR